MDDFATFDSFYPYYLTKHRNRTNRRCHLIGDVAAIALAAVFVVTGNWWLLPAAIAAAYACSWVGHVVFERNSPAAFGNPLYSLWGNVVMAKDMLTGRLSA